MIHTSTARHHELKVSLQSGITYLLSCDEFHFDGMINSTHYTRTRTVSVYMCSYTSFQRMLLFLLSSALYISYSFAHTRTHTHKSKAKPLTALVGHAFLVKPDTCALSRHYVPVQCNLLEPGQGARRSTDQGFI